MAPATAAAAGKDWANCSSPPRAITAADYPAAAERSDVLSPAEAEHFCEFGWVIKRALVPAAALRPFVDQAWADVAQAGVHRDEPHTWRDPGERWVPSPNFHGNHLRYFDADSRYWSGALGHDPAFLAATSRHPRMQRMVESILGGPIRQPNRNRGLYCIFPRDDPERTLGPHVDSQSEELLATTYLGAVGPEDGGFAICESGSFELCFCGGV
jgi:hypothetical protein